MPVENGTFQICTKRWLSAAISTIDGSEPRNRPPRLTTDCSLDGSSRMRQEVGVAFGRLAVYTMRGASVVLGRPVRLPAVVTVFQQ